MLTNSAADLAAFFIGKRHFSKNCSVFLITVRTVLLNVSIYTVIPRAKKTSINTFNEPSPAPMPRAKSVKKTAMQNRPSKTAFTFSLCLITRIIS